MNDKPLPERRPTQARPPRPVRPNFLPLATPSDARLALQQSLDRRW